MQKERIYLILIIVGAILLRLSFAIPSGLDYEAWFHFRQIKSITERGIPIFNDNLSYGGRTNIFLPTFHYIIAFFSFLMPLQAAAKFIPNILAISTIAIIYLIGMQITKNKKAALLAAAASAFIPIFLEQTFNSLSPLSLAIPYFFLMLYLFIDIKSKKKFYTFLAMLFAAPFIHPIAFFFVLALLFYLGISRIEGMQRDPAETELILFAFFYTLWAYFLIFKKAIIAHGPSVLWAGIPPQLLPRYFYEISIIEAVFKIGIIPALLGLFMLYRYIFRKRERGSLLVVSAVLSASILFWLKLLEPNAAFILLSLSFGCLLAPFYRDALSYIKKSKFGRLQSSFFTIVMMALFVTLLIPAISALAQKADQSPKKLDPFIAAKQLKPCTIAAPIYEGHMLTAIAEQKNIADTNYLLAPQAAQRAKDLQTLFSTKSEINALLILNKYNAEYILISEKTKKEKLEYLKNKNCFKKVFASDAGELYEVLCEVKVK